MAKRLIIVWLFTMTILLFSSISIYADEDARGDFFIKNVIINGEKIVNYNLQYSVILYDETMYIPLTPEMCKIYGIKAEMDWKSHTLKLFKTEPEKRNISENWLKNNLEPLAMNVLSDAKAFACVQEESYYIYDTLELVEPSEPIVEEIDLNGMPLLEKDRNVYIPLRAMSGNEAFGWDIHFSNYYGICISTDGETPAKKYYNSKEALENKGLVNYMIRYNPSITPSYGQQLVFLFKRAGEVYSVDPKLIMSIAHAESKFNAASVSRSGASGMMQVMPATGARYGLTQEQLMDPKTAIDFGAMYISERLEAYNGDWSLALSAYNQGSNRVNRGAYSNVYSNKVLSIYSGIENYMATNGYIQ